MSAQKTARTCHCKAEGPLHPTHEAPECESFEKLERGATKAGSCEERSDAAIPLIPHELWSREIATSSTSGGLLATSRLPVPGRLPRFARNIQGYTRSQGDRHGKASRPSGLPRQGLVISDCARDMRAGSMRAGLQSHGVGGVRREKAKDRIGLAGAGLALTERKAHQAAPLHGQTVIAEVRLQAGNRSPGQPRDSFQGAADRSASDLKRS